MSGDDTDEGTANESTAADESAPREDEQMPAERSRAAGVGVGIGTGIGAAWGYITVLVADGEPAIGLALGAGAGLLIALIGGVTALSSAG